jgi:hypothetical protein
LFRNSIKAEAIRIEHLPFPKWLAQIHERLLTTRRRESLRGELSF